MVRVFKGQGVACDRDTPYLHGSGQIPEIYTFLNILLIENENHYH